MKRQFFRSLSAVSAILVVGFCLRGSLVLAQQAPATGQTNTDQTKTDQDKPAANTIPSTAPASTATAPSSPAKTPAAPPSAAAENSTESKVPGFDTKRGVPLYETIQEDWSSLQVGVSKLEPQPPMIGGIEDQPTFTRVMARVQWRPGDPVDLYILMPKGVKKPPVVLYLYGPDPGNDNRFMNNDWATRVTGGGVAAVGFNGALMGPRFRNRPMKQWFISEFQETLGSTVHDVKFILDYLNESGELDMNRVGMFGEGVGGSIAILAAAADPRIKVVDTLEPWGDWPVFLSKSPAVTWAPNHEDFVTPEFLKKVAPLEPTKWLAELKIPVRIQQVKDSKTMPEECKDAMAKAAPKQLQLTRFASVADLSKVESGGKLFQWVKDNLRKPDEKTADAKTSVAEKTSPDRVAAQK